MSGMVMLRQRAVNVLAAGLALVSAAPVWADADPLVEGARLCTQRFPVEERSNQIPTHLLAAIATTESGRWHEGLGMNVPWPWTINVEGKGYYFDSKAAAIAQTKLLQAQGRQSIDVGCMQVNLKQHAKAFANLEDAFDPQKNVNYAARFLRENYADLGDWIKATAAYHSRTPQYGARYLGEIERSWNKIVAKVAAARAGKGGEKVSATASVRNPVVPTKTRVVEAAPAKAVAKNNVKPALAHARVIQVRDAAPAATRRESPVMVVRATPAPTVVPVIEQANSVTVAEATPAVEATLPAGNSIRQVNLDNAATSALARPQASAPNYVFAN